jgi:hypothetical protein
MVNSSLRLGLFEIGLFVLIASVIIVGSDDHLGDQAGAH